MPRVAIVQAPPVLLDRAATLGRAVASLREAAAAGAQLVVLTEAYVPGYPVWVWRLRPGTDLGLAERWDARLREQAVDLSRGDLAPLCEAARELALTVVCGVDEVDGDFSRGTLYNTAVVIGPDGRLLSRHRKLVPTSPERMVWGWGDASGLRVVDTPCGRVGVLICWESYMPLARYALYAQGVEIYVAPTYDCGETWLATMRHVAREGGCWVLGSGWALQGRDVPGDLPDRDRLYPDADEWINAGDSVVVAPGGRVVAGPLHQRAGLLLADLDLSRVGTARRSLDVAGHYARCDLFRLRVDREPRTPVEINDRE